jgi:curved DNA-binding protein
MADPYSVLGVSRTADSKEIRKAYRALAKRFHPDRNKSKSAEDRFKSINGAYDVVGDEHKRKLYDEFGDASLKAGFDADRARSFRSAGRGGPFGGFDFSGGGGNGNVDDLLSSLFGAGGLGGRPRRGSDQQTEVTIDFLTAVRGGKRSVKLQKPDGTVEPITIPVPPGAKDGGRVRLRGLGLPPIGGGPCGDLLVTLKVAAHPVLKRENDNLLMDLPLTIHEAMAGATLTIPTPTGEVKLNVPPGARSGARLRLKGRGVQRPGRPGDLYLVLRPMVPKTSDPALLAAAEAIDSAYDRDVRSGLKL